MYMKRPFYKTLFFKIVAGVFFLLLVGCFFVGLWLWKQVYEPNVLLNESTYIYIPTGGGFQQLKDTLWSCDIVRSRKSFEWIAEKKGLPERIKPGRYEIAPGMSNNDLANLFRSGKQAPLNVTINNIRTKEILSGRMGEVLELDSLELLGLLNNPQFLKKYDKNPQTAMALFVPNTYQLFWNTDAEEFVERMKKEYDRFWNDERKEKAQKMALSPDEVVTLASIVQEETNKNDEKQRIAGVYMNRLQSGWLLQADPTLKFALGDFTIRRVLDEHKAIESPYNTYKNIGLPPGPISMPDIASIDAVLNYETHGYYYFCAKDDLSGYHVFSSNLAQHNINARKYHNALNRMRIYR